MNAQHQILLSALRGRARSGRVHHSSDSYLGSGHLYLDVSVPNRRAIAKAWVAQNNAAPLAEVFAVLDSLFQGESHEEKTLAALILACHPRARAGAKPAQIERWLDALRGWAEVDTLCQNVFTAEDMAAAWSPWKRLIARLSRDKSTHKRRAALVLLNGPVHYSDDRRFAALAFDVIDRVKDERDGMITKAVSWTLRSLITRHRSAVIAYLDANEACLPKLALRETRTKLQTGTKADAARASGERRVVWA